MNKLFYRFEFKYFIMPLAEKSIEKELKRFGMKLDAPSILLGDGYYVTSLYFDSYDFKDYQDKCGGFKKRKKIRARIYEPYLEKSSSVMLELKKKDGERIGKTQLRLSRGEWQNFAERGVSSLLGLERHGPEENKNKNELIRNIIISAAKPQVVIRYKRKPYIATTSSALRVTFDSCLEARKTTDLGRNVFMTPIDEINRKGTILEVKSNYAMPQWLGRIIKDFNLKNEAISKYAYGVEAVFKYNPLFR
ncbi:MAG: hypothetical protein A3J46_05390 [Candidatus Yanofskybacteria bacterium RIFCSPHIGHO2_02_FULL_41_11]|uniref:VTC domain-containing protein n=1 Tax=Candidatus Yanofskybacteria bacterium RIFCSPHIGHO2_02_FULL_41_11 TaxID=1802675 RepID=A0A1F8FBT8_9BACT|nr:MAG: hypothetical protein A3J46_05390 [Candidatus Yanofskybacteria bacterium RIFCSPHIGHO2_02_FULL_41_11]